MADKYVWQDREIRFDVNLSALELRAGENVIDSLNNVEDTKGNGGEGGTLMITNLRTIWISSKYAKTNLTIGYNCIVNITIRSTTSRLRGNTQALYVLTKFNNTRFEFIFTNLVPNNARLFSTVQAVHRAYERTKLYRDLKLRGAIIRDKQLILLPEESIYHKVNGVWNLSSEQGNLGTFFITNVRLVWHGNMVENFNVSIPFLQMKSIRVQNSKFGLALVIETMPQSGGYVLGFRLDPPDQLYEVAKEIQNIHSVFSKNPLFGVNFVTEEKTVPISQLKMKRSADDVEIIDTEEDNDSLAVYYADIRISNADREPVWNQDLGLAVEKLREGFTVQNLWQVVHN